MKKSKITILLILLIGITGLISCSNTSSTSSSSSGGGGNTVSCHFERDKLCMEGYRKAFASACGNGGRGELVESCSNSTNICLMILNRDGVDFDIDVFIYDSRGALSSCEGFTEIINSSGFGTLGEWRLR